VSKRERISVLVAQGDDALRAEVEAILAEAEDIEVVGVTRTGDAALVMARKLEPAILLVDYDLPGRDGIETTQALATLLPDSAVIVLAADMSADVLRRAMVAGARQFVGMPPRAEDLLRAIYEVHDTAVRRAAAGGTRAPKPVRAGESTRVGQTIAVFSPKGGVGTTTVATNLAVAIRHEAGLRVTLVDGALPFADVGVFLDLPPVHSIVDLQVPAEGLDADLVDTALTTHERSGVRVLLAPARPELADMVTGELLRRAIGALRERADYVVVDTWAVLEERVLTVLEAADKVVLVLSLDMAVLKSAKVFLEVADLLGFPREKIIPVATRTTAPAGLTIAGVEAALGRPLSACIPDDRTTVQRAINEGEPLVLSGRGTPVAVAITDLARRILAEHHPDAVTQSLLDKGGGAGLFRLFGRG